MESDSPTESGVWRVDAASRRAGSGVRRPTVSAWSAALAWCTAVVFLGGTIALCAITLVEIAQRLVELGGRGDSRVRNVVESSEALGREGTHDKRD